MASEPPPAHSTLQETTTTSNNANAVTEEPVANCEVSLEPLVNNCFENKTNRIAFQQKVLAIRLLQMLEVTLVLCIFTIVDYDHNDRTADCFKYIALSTITILVTIRLIFYCNHARHKHPYGYLLLVIHPLSYAILLGFLYMLFSHVEPILVAWLTFTGGFFSVVLYSVFALQTNMKCTGNHYIAVAVFVQFFLYVITIPTNHDNATVLWSAIALASNYFYVFWDFEFMTSGTYWHTIMPADFVVGALYLHIDILLLIYYSIINIIRPKLSRCLQRCFY